MGASLSQIITRWIRVAPAALAVISVGLVALIVTNDIYNEREQEAVEATRLARTSHEAMLDQLSGLTAYATTGGAPFLGTYMEGRDRLAAVTPALDDTLPDIAPATTMRMRMAQQTWLERWVPDALAAGRAGGVEGAAAEELLADGKGAFDRYRAAQADLLETMIDHRDQAIDSQATAVERTAALGVLLSLVLSLVAVRRGRRLRRTIEPALDGVLADLARIRARELDPTPTRGGPAELAQIELGIAETAGALREMVAQGEEQAERVSRQNRHLGQVLRLSREVAGSLNLDYVVEGVCTSTAAIAEARVIVWLRDDGAGELVARADSTAVDLIADGFAPVVLGSGPVGRAARFARTEGHRGRGLEETPSERNDVLAVPMVVGAEVVGVIEVVGADVSHLPQTTVDVLEALAVQAATAIGAARVHEHTEVLAMTDALTGLPNRRRMEVDLATEVAVAARHARPLGFAMVDVDHFKAYNDELGHQAGDVALQTLAQVLQGNIRAGDAVYRYGGEELAILMRETDTAGSHLYAERLRRLVEHHFEAPAQLRAVTISIGVASMPDDAASGELLVASADAALYEAKRRGRNQVVAAGGIIAGRQGLAPR